ncbi:type II toxin-antitoxin system VapC family toxin [Serinibacter salmoneus]|uniref:Ribonuclease VapC n=1 Tax=Serinibacter salmoneus TaxID=556530 RepID=A0A2A9D3B9_9MICO|nr:type II toxin-antitoxin system VapC family toxin [Serinibacter salmoneus]PFG21208.1 PIN domain nuclease of toxin-antitoxin system [Serinibacter salmoneus]
MGVRPRYLLDTHVLLWMLAAPSRIPAEPLAELRERRTHLFVSAASAMEVATKTRLGRLPGGEALVAGWEARLAELGVEDLPIDGAAAIAAGAMTWEHRDPFDRLLAAQALRENLTLVTVDSAVLAFPGVRTLTW